MRPTLSLWASASALALGCASPRQAPAPAPIAVATTASAPATRPAAERTDDAAAGALDAIVPLPMATPPSAATVAPASSAEPPSGDAAGATEPKPRAKRRARVENIGVHIGGGPNDDATKAPVRASIAPHFDELSACFDEAEGARGGDFGVDLRIPAVGGRAKVGPHRTTLRGEPFVACVLAVFEGIDFARPRGGATVASYSLRFTP